MSLPSTQVKPVPELEIDLTLAQIKALTTKQKKKLLKRLIKLRHRREAALADQIRRGEGPVKAEPPSRRAHVKDEPMSVRRRN